MIKLLLLTQKLHTWFLVAWKPHKHWVFWVNNYGMGVSNKKIEFFMHNNPLNDHHWMQQALALAKKAQEQQEVPVGAILILNNTIIGSGWNQPIRQNDPTAHAEIMALRAAGQHRQNYRLIGATLYVTLEPCTMCVGALIHARIGRLVFGALDHKSGAVASKLSLLDSQHFNHKIAWEGGCLAPACGRLLTEFFLSKR